MRYCVLDNAMVPFSKDLIARMIVGPKSLTPSYLPDLIEACILKWHILKWHPFLPLSPSLAGCEDRIAGMIVGPKSLTPSYPPDLIEACILKWHQSPTLIGVEIDPGLVLLCDTDCVR